MTPLKKTLIPTVFKVLIAAFNCLSLIKSNRMRGKQFLIRFQYEQRIDHLQYTVA